MERRRDVIFFVSVSLLLVLGACVQTQVTSKNLVETGRLPRPGHIWVYDFAATPDDLPDDPGFARHHAEHDVPQTAEHIATGRHLGSEIASHLAEEIHGMGLPAKHASRGTKLQINDIVIRGYLISVNEGDAKKRVLVGFGKGTSELHTAVEGLQMTAQGLRRLGEGTTESGKGGKTPGAAVGLAALVATGNPAGLIIGTGMKVYGEKSGKSTVEGRAGQTAQEIADVLKKRFQKEGWIN